MVLAATRVRSIAPARQRVLSRTRRFVVFLVVSCVFVQIICLRFLFRLANASIHFDDFSRLPPLPSSPSSSTGSTVLEHPHAGARFEDGRFGLIVDPSPQRLLPAREPPCPLDTDAPIESKKGRLILDKVHRGVQESQNMLLAASSDHKTSALPRILCMVYTRAGAHDSLEAIARTWAHRCDGFFAASTQTNHSIGAIDLPHQGKEEYGNMWQKVRSMWAYVYDHYLEDYDYFHICGDDTYVVVDNLRAYLHSPYVKELEAGHPDVFSRANDPEGKSAKLKPRPLLFGMPFFGEKYKFPLGGPGYTLNAASVKLFAEKCIPEFKPNATDSREDVFVGTCIQSHGVVTADTSDAARSWRYVEDVQVHAAWNNSDRGFSHPRKMARQFGLTFAEKGIDFVSSQAISFHLKLGLKGKPSAERMYRYDQLIHYNDSYCGTAKVEV